MEINEIISYLNTDIQSNEKVNFLCLTVGVTTATAFESPSLIIHPYPDIWAPIHFLEWLYNHGMENLVFLLFFVMNGYIPFFLNYWSQLNPIPIGYKIGLGYNVHDEYHGQGHCQLIL